MLNAPVGLEPRGDFLKRLRRTVAWMNENRRDHGRVLCCKQKKRAKDVLALKGARSKW